VRVRDRSHGPGVKRAQGLRGAFLLVVAILLGSVVAPRAADAPKRVLILHAYNYTFPATTIASEAARKRLLEGSRQAIEIEADFLDLARMPGDEHATRMANFLRQKYAKMHFDVVLVIGTEGVPFIIKYRYLISPGVPVVFAGGSPANYAAIQLPADVTGVMSGIDADKILELGERLQPKATRRVVIGGSGKADRGWQETTRKAVENRNSKFETTFRFDLTYDAMLAEVSRLPADTIVLLLSVYADSAGRPLIPKDVAVAVAKASAAPVYGPFGTFLGTGIVGGYVETYESMGIATADLALEILSGKEAATLPPRVSPGQAFLVDARAMERWGLKQSNLPPGSKVLFQEPSLWDQHRNLVLGALLVIGLQSLFLAGLLFQRRRRRQAEISLRESEERMTFTAASVNAGLWQFDRATDELWATEHCRSMFGLADDIPLTRETFLAAVHPEDRRVAVATLRGALRGQAASTDVRVVRPDGAVRWIRVRVRSHLDQGTPDQLSGLFVDITDQKAAETEAEQQRQEVTHLMRVTTMGELSGAIAHEVNQPLTAILTNAQSALYLLDQDTMNRVEMRNTLLDIVSEDKRAGEVVQRLRGLLKKGESQSEAVDLNELVDATTALLRNELIRRQILVEADLAMNLPAVFGDSVQLQQVLLNLVMNAVDAVSAIPVPQRRVMIRTLQTPAGDIQVLIRDHGPGINMENWKQAFVPFFTTKDHGLGLGLSICSTIIRKHGGTINLRNDDSGGAVAEFTLPARVMMMAAQ
jgi:PAS domain S-box-containing protein